MATYNSSKCSGCKYAQKVGKNITVKEKYFNYSTKREEYRDGTKYVTEMVCTYHNYWNGCYKEEQAAKERKAKFEREQAERLSKTSPTCSGTASAGCITVCSC